MLTNCLAAYAHLTITVSDIKRNICEKSSFYDTPLHSTPPLVGFPSEYRHPVWYGKTRMVGLPDGEKIEDICNGLDTIPACDRQTDGRTDGRTSCHGIYALLVLGLRGPVCNQMSPHFDS